MRSSREASWSRGTWVAPQTCVDWRNLTMDLAIWMPATFLLGLAGLGL